MGEIGKGGIGGEKGERRGEEERKKDKWARLKSAAHVVFSMSEPGFVGVSDAASVNVLLRYCKENRAPVRLCLSIYSVC